jgi:hypothetical protein
VRRATMPLGRSCATSSASVSPGHDSACMETLGQRCSLPPRGMLELWQPLTNLEKALPTARSAFAAGGVRACELATVIVVCLACRMPWRTLRPAARRGARRGRALWRAGAPAGSVGS